MRGDFNKKICVQHIYVSTTLKQGRYPYSKHSFRSGYRITSHYIYLTLVLLMNLFKIPMTRLSEFSCNIQISPVQTTWQMRMNKSSSNERKLRHRGFWITPLTLLSLVISLASTFWISIQLTSISHKCKHKQTCIKAAIKRNHFNSYKLTTTFKSRQKNTTRIVSRRD